MTHQNKYTVTKLHGLGNNFIIIDNRQKCVAAASALAKEICSINYGIGADGLILLENSSEADFRMRIFNSDGSEPEMCGNGIRCFAWYIAGKKISTQNSLRIMTGAGIIKTDLISHSGNSAEVQVDMGMPSLSGKDFTAKPGISTALIDGREYFFVSMGNPHAVTFVEDFNFDYTKTGQSVENNSVYFPHKTNVEFIRVVSDNELDMRVWERGCGETTACGTGACASVVAAKKKGHVASRIVTVHLPGGDLRIEWEETFSVLMTGPAQTVLEGTYFYGTH